MGEVSLCLDAGHYGKYNRSPVVPEFYESEFNWKLHLLLKKYLEEYGFNVTITRERQAEDMDLYERGRRAKGHDLFLSVHANWAARESADYPVAYVPINGSGDEIGRVLAQCVREVMGTQEEAMIQSKKSTKGNWDWYGVIYGANEVGVPGIILEHSFYSNKRSATWLMDDGNLDKLARAEAAVLAKHYGLERKEPEPEHWYRIRKSWGDAASQKGAYKSLELAKENCPEGYYVFDWKGVAVYPTEAEYTQKQFVMDIQNAFGAAVDGIAGAETLGKTVTLSARKNSFHKAVKYVQKWLAELNYTEVGKADGIAGPRFTAAVIRFQQENDCIADGEITAGNKTWRKLLGMK